MAVNQPCFLHSRFLAKSHQISSNNYSVHITLSVSCKNGMSTETKLHSKVKPRYHNEDKPGDITAPSTTFSNCLHRIFTGVLCGAQNFPWVMPLSNLDPPGAKEMIFTSLGEIWSLFTTILNFRFSLGVSLG